MIMDKQNRIITGYLQCGQRNCSCFFITEGVFNISDVLHVGGCLFGYFILAFKYLDRAY